MDVTARERLPLLLPHLILAGAAVLIFAALHANVGLITVSDGLGWDGEEYARMLRRGWDSGGTNTALRPMIVWLAQPAFEMTRDVVRAFDITNYVYVALLAFLYSRFMERYGAPMLACAVGILCVSVSAGFQLAAYYPVTIDLGGHAILALLLWQILAGPRWAIAVASIAAVLSREYAPAVMLFGLIRDLRQRVPIVRIVTTYLPASIVYVVLRLAVEQSIGEGNSLRTFIANLVLWKDPLWAAFYVYFAVTAIAGISMIVAAQPRRWWPVIREEPEWLGLAVPVLVVTGVVGLDLWRYLLVLTPLALVLFARCSREWQTRETAVFLSAAVGLTVVTQMPFQGMDVTRFFVDWFPYWAWSGKAPAGITGEMLWPTWGWRFLFVTLAMSALMIYDNTRQRSAVVTT